MYDWDLTGEVAAEARRLVDERLERLPWHCTATVARLRTVSGDYRLVADYLWSTETGNQVAIEFCEQIALEPDERRRGRLRYQLGKHRFGRLAQGPISVRTSVAEVLDAEDDGISAYVVDPDQGDVFRTLFADLGPGLSAFIENQHEVPGPNARIRQGTVKSWFLPDGSQVSSKRENPLKPDRFRHELEAYEEVARRLEAHGTPGPVWMPDQPSRVLRQVPLMAVVRDGAAKRNYAIYRWITGTSLECVLLNRNSGTERARVFQDHRALIDLLFDCGILWGDLSPRNILLSRRDDDHNDEVLYILDFEKTTFVEPPVDPEYRITHCRGQLAVEELGVWGTPDEVSKCLRGYFDPKGWDLHATTPVTFPPRPEVVAILAGKGITELQLGLYNQTDLEIYTIRSPYTDPSTGRRRYPGQVAFRVEHYLSCAGEHRATHYDRATTEVLMAARRANHFEAAFGVLERGVDAVERAFVLAEVRGLLNGDHRDGTITPPWAEIHQLTALLDELYAARDESDRLRAVCEGLAGTGRVV